MNISNKPALVIGSGPSVDQIDPSWLSHFETYGCNAVFKKFPEWRREVDNIVITDSNRLNEIGCNYENFQGNLYVGDERYIDPPVIKIEKILKRKIIPLRRLVKRSMPVNSFTKRICFSRYLFNTVFERTRFAFSLEEGLNFGSSVVISAIQLAIINGHKKIVLVGVDSNYKNDKDYADGIESTIQYVNHTFIENPRLYMEPVLVALQISSERFGVEIIDCSEGGKLKYIQKGHLTDYL